MHIQQVMIIAVVGSAREGEALRRLKTPLVVQLYYDDDDDKNKCWRLLVSKPQENSSSSICEPRRVSVYTHKPECVR